MGLFGSKRTPAKCAVQPHADGVEIHQSRNPNTPLPSLCGLQQHGD